MAKEPLLIRCRNALRYYVGDATAYPNVPDDPKAYNTLNALFFEGTESECARAAEGKVLNPAFLDAAYDTLPLCADLLTALRYGGMDKEAEQTVYRVSRKTDVDQMIQAKMSVSFTSTSKGGFLDAYGDKDKLILLEIRIAPHAPRADMAELLYDDYAKPDEQEVLLPPWLPMQFEEVTLSETEQRIRDRNGDAPVAKYIVRTGERMAYPAGNDSFDEKAGREAGKRVYEALAKKNVPNGDDLQAYAAWKSSFLTMVTRLTQSVNRLGEALSAEMDRYRYITEKNYTLEDLFKQDKAADWLMALLGIKAGTDFADRIEAMTAARLIHTISTYLLGCHLQRELLLSFDRLPRIFSGTTSISPFSFFWSIACLCHDLGYSYEGNKADERAKMLNHDERVTLLGIEHDFLTLTDDELKAMGLEGEELEWVRESIALVGKYNEFRVKHHKTIDHGIAGGLILYDYAKRIARPKKHATRRDPEAAAKHVPINGQLAANSEHSRFTLCCLMIALTVARHNIWTQNAGTSDAKDYENYGLGELILGKGCEPISIAKPVNQLLYMLEYMDTIDPVKAFYTHPVERKLDGTDLRREYLLDDIYIRCIRHPGDWHQIEFSFGKPTFASDSEPVTKYLNDASTISDWMNTKPPVREGDSGICFSFPAVNRTRKANPYGITDEEIMDLCLYQGSGDTVRPGEFYQIPNAYQSFNLFMMKGLAGERVRVGTEAQRPYGLYIRQWRDTIKVFKSVFTAQCIYYRQMSARPERLYRCDRKANTDMMQDQHRTFAYTSTSKNGYLKVFSENKEKATFLQCELIESVPIADYQEILGDSYAFMDEAEVLLPPFLGMAGTEKLTEEEYRIRFGSMRFNIPGESRAQLEATLDEYRETAAETLDAFREKPELAQKAEEADYSAYRDWKDAFQKLVELELAEIWNHYKR